MKQKRAVESTATCPRCNEVIFLRAGDRPGRLFGICRCNPAGPVLDVQVQDKPGVEPDTMFSVEEL